MKIAILIPINNDWLALGRLLEAIRHEIPRLAADVAIYVVDDGSTLSAPVQDLRRSLGETAELHVIELTSNLGHQRAIAVGLAYLDQTNAYDVTIVMDGDGEDRPQDLPRILEAYLQKPDAIFVAQRARRSEGLSFALFYFFYKVTFRILTGKTIDFGNFCILSKSHVARLVYMPELWNHLAATILLSKISVHRLPTVRGLRYAGRSSMNVLSLITHGLSAIGVFSDLLFVRLLVSSLLLAGGGAVIGVVAIFIRATTNLAIPGWATTVVGLAAILVAQALTLSMTAAFMTLNMRKNLLFVPAINGFAFIRNTNRAT